MGSKARLHKLSHIERSKCPTALNTHACSRLRKFWTALATRFWGRSFHAYHPQSCATLLDCWWLTVFILSTRLQMCNADYLHYQFNSETCHRRYSADAMVLSFSGMALQLTAHATQDWLHATAITLLQNMNGHQTRQILICLIIMCGVPCWKPITSWISQAGQVSHQQSRSFKQDWRWPEMTFLRNLWQGLSRTFVSDCKLACSRLADTLNIQCDWLCVNVPSNPFPWQFSRRMARQAQWAGGRVSSASERPEPKAS